MRRVYIVCAALLACLSFGGFARATDLGLELLYKAPPPVATWSGFYFGGGGSQTGVDFQVNRFVLGVTSSGDVAKFNSTAPDIPAFSGGMAAQNLSASPIGGVGGRIGYAFGDYLLPFVKGGPAWLRADSAFSALAPATGGDGRSGWFFGGGVEMRYLPGLSLFLEYDHYDFGSAAVNNVVTFSNAHALGPTGLPFGTPFTSSSAKIGVNWHPEWLSPPPR